MPAWETLTQHARTVSSELIMYSPEILLQCMVAVIMLYIFHPTPGFVESILVMLCKLKIELSVNVYTLCANFYADYNSRMCVIFPELSMLYTR